MASTRLRYPKVTFSPGSFVARDCCFVGEAVVGRDVCLTKVSFGKGVIVRDRTVVANSNFAEHVVVNRDSVIDSTNMGRFSYIGAEGQFSMVEVGSFCSIAQGVICGSGEHPANFASTHPAFFSLGLQSGVTFAKESLFDERKKIIIGNDVWIGTRVFIRDGVTVGDGAIIAAGSVVVKDIPAYAIVGGIPAKVIKFRFEEDVVAGLLALKWWEWDESQLRAAQPLMASDDVKAFLNKYTGSTGDQQ